nr:hypothetical protein [Tanacetum cinerariifolium]
MHKAFPLPVIEFPLAEEFPTASEESCHCQKKRKATVVKIALLVIKFRDSYVVPASAETTDTASDGTSKKKRRTVTVTADDMQRRNNDVKARTTLLPSLRDEHQLRFKGTETLEQMFNRLQVIVSQLQFMNVEIEQDDLNQKFLSSLDPEWLMHKIKKLEPNPQNMAFISSAKHSRGNEDVTTTSVSTASTNVSTTSTNVGVASINQDTACAYIAFQSSGFQIKFEDINQIDKDDKEEIAIKWNMALLSMRADRFWKKIGKKISIQGSDVAGFDKSKSYMANDEENHALVAEKEAPIEFALMANTSDESKVFDNSLCSKDCKKNTDSLNTSKDLDSLLERQRLDKNKEGLGNSVVPPPPAQLYSSSKKDLSWTGLPEFKDDTVTDYSRPASTVESSPDDAQNRNPFVTKEASPSTIPHKSFIKFVKANDSPSKSPNFEMKKHACFNCGDFNHLAYDCRKKVKKRTSRSQNNTHKSFTPRPVVHKPYRPPMRPMRSNMNDA